MEMKYIYGPVPSRRLGLSLGVSPIPQKTCNYTCIYCQLGRTNHLTNTRSMFFALEDILAEFDQVDKSNIEYDLITIVGEGEPTLYLGLGELIEQLKLRTTKPIAVITNGALLYDSQVRAELVAADIVLPTLDAVDEQTFKKICRPHGKIKYDQVRNGLIDFSREYQGQLWLEIMLIKDINDDDESLAQYADMLRQIDYDKLYLNTPVRPPAEAGVEPLDEESMAHAAEFLGGISIDLLTSSGFHSEITDDYAAIKSIITRHPMNQFEIKGFLETRNCANAEDLLAKLTADPEVEAIDYKGFVTYRIKTVKR